MKTNTLVFVTIFFSLLLLSPLTLAAGRPAQPVLGTAGEARESHAGHGEHGGGGAGSMTWSGYPMLKPRMSGDGRDRRAVTVVPQNIVANSIEDYPSDSKGPSGRRQLPLEMAGARLDKPEEGGFHWLAAREEQGDSVRVASTVYFFSDRGGKNPTAMFMQQKGELEIIPQPFPREHSRYRSNEDWKFLVRFDGKPLSGQRVALETQNGTKGEFLSDAQGMVNVHLPDDFKAESQQKTAGKHDHGRPLSDFVLATGHSERDKKYLTAFNGSYGPDAFDQRSLAMGLGFTLLGMVGAAPLLLHRKPLSCDTESEKGRDAAC